MFDDREDYMRRIREAARDRTPSWDELYCALKNLVEDVSSGALDTDSLYLAAELIKEEV